MVCESAFLAWSVLRGRLCRLVRSAQQTIKIGVILPFSGQFAPARIADAHRLRRIGELA